MVTKDGSFLNIGHSAKLNADGIWEYDLSKGLKIPMPVNAVYKELPELEIIPILENNLKSSYSHILKVSIDKILNKIKVGSV